MSKDQDLAATVAKLADTVGELTRSVQRLEKINAPRLASELAAERMIERDRKLTAIAKIDDAAERAKAMGALHSVDDVLYTSGEMDDERLLETLEAADANARAKIVNALPPQREMSLAVARLPAPFRVRVRLGPSVTRVATAAIPGPRPSDRYPGFNLPDRDMRHVELRSQWEQRLRVDEELAGLVAMGSVVVEDVPEAESRRMLHNEVMAREPAERPQLRFSR